MKDRTCIVSRETGPAEGMIRFVADPEGRVVADLKGKLPGRGCWVAARRDAVEKAVGGRQFSRALKARVDVPDDLADQVDGLLRDALVGMMGMARKAGQLVTGAAKVDAALRSGKAIAVFHAVEASPDGVRKLEQAAHAVSGGTKAPVPVFRSLSARELAVLGGGGEVIHLAALAGQAGEGVVKRAKKLDRYRMNAIAGQVRETESE